MTITYYDVEQRSAEWFALRKGIITASSMKHLMPSQSAQALKKRRETGEIVQKESAQKYAYQLAYERIASRLDEKFCSNEYFERGNDFESVARETLETRLMKPVKECGIYIAEHSWGKVGASPDGLLDDGGIIEIKTRDAVFTMESIITMHIPKDYMSQVQAQLWVTGAPYCVFLSYTEGLRPFFERVLPDREMHKEFEECCIVTEENIQKIVKQYEAADNRGE